MYSATSTPARDERGKFLGVSPTARGATGSRLNPNNWSGLNASAIPAMGADFETSVGGAGERHAMGPGGALATYENYAAPATTTHGSSTANRALSVAAAAPTGASVARASNVHAMLSNAERELAMLREEHAIRGAEIDTLKAQLQREHETNLRMQSRHETDLNSMREEYERQHSQLVEQITVLKGVSESALQEKKKSTEEATTRKAQLMALLEKEREEKSSIMADYRAQTEALIAEQGREIAGLRGLLDLAKEEEERYVAGAKQFDIRRAELEEQLLKAETALADERVAGQRRLRDAELRHTSQLEQLRERQDREESALRQALLKATSQREQLEDENRSLAERLKLVERTNEQERDTLKRAYDTDVATLQNELRVSKDNRERMESKLKAEIERLTRGDEELIASLRKEIEALRQAKQSQFAEWHREKEAATTEHHSKLGAMQAAIDGLRKELSEERAARKAAESAQQSLGLKCEGQQAALNRLQNELEALQIDSRTRERAAEQNHNDAVETLRNQIHALEGDNAQLKQSTKRLQVDLQRASDESATRQALIDQLKTEYRRDVEMHKAQLEAAAAQAKEAERVAIRNIELLQAQRVQLEADVNRLARGLDEMESRAATATKQLADERQALEAAMAETQNYKALLGDVRAALDSEKHKSAAALAAVVEREAEVNMLRASQEDAATNLREARRQGDRLRDEMNAVAAAHEAANAELRAAQRSQVAQLEAQLQTALSNQSHARDAAHALEEQLRVVRDEVTKWQRECIAKDEKHADEIRGLRSQEDNELAQLENVIQSLRDDLARVQSQKAAMQREIAEAQRDGERRAGLVQEALDAERSSKARLHEELRNKEQLAAELNGTVRLLSARVTAKEDDVRRLESEIEDLSAKVHDAHSTIGKKEAVIGQLAAKLRVYESRGLL